PARLGGVGAAHDLPGLTGDSYHLELGVSPREAANRAWSVLTGAWTAYRDALAARPEGDRATGLTREKWLGVMLRELGFGRVSPTPAGGIAADGRAFAVSHLWHEVPVHLLGWGVDLDRRTPGVAGAAERAPHAMVQELLNRSSEHTWALLANGATLRLLRDSSSLVGQAYVEFDLAAMFDGEVFSDFAVLFLLCHQSRFEPAGPEAGPEDCWLERWRSHAVESGIRALGAMRPGVQRAIEALGTGFLRHPANADLRQRLGPSGSLGLDDFHHSLLRLVYRLLFCFVAEDRGLLLDPHAPAQARRRYTQWFSTARLRAVATRRRGTGHGDLWQALSLVLDGLGRDGGRPELGLPALGGLFEATPADVVEGCELSNQALLEALRHLCVVQPPGGGPRRVVDYRHLGAEELGGIYESLLELVPRHDAATRAFTLEALVGNERKTSGSYYTPSSLIDCLLDSALDPLLDEAEQAPDPEAALLALTVCDPACGSGHFLVAAARRIAARLARVRADGSEPTVLESQAAMHDVVGRAIFGVDLNPLAAELAKVSLWLEALQPGRPLSFLDAHVKVGNALLGTTPALLAAGIPDDAYTPLEGDDRKVVSSLRKRNRTERTKGLSSLFASVGIWVDNRSLAEAARAVDAAGALSLADVALARRRQRDLEHSSDLRRARLVADAWCAAFVIAKRAGAPELTHVVLERWQQAEPASLVGDELHAEVARLAARYRFFHWHLEFPQIFTVTGSGSTDAGWSGGFSCVLGNPPWERVKLSEQEFFASRAPDIGGAPNAAARKRLIAALAGENRQLLAEFEAAKRQADGESHLIRQSGRYPLCGRGDVNTYAVFAEHDRSLLGDRGRLGVILPTGIATDATTQHFFKDLVARRSLVSLFDFENSKPLFEGVHRSFKFCLLTLAGRGSPVDAADFAFFAREPADLARPGVRFELTPEEITLLNPNTGTCPVFRTRRDAEITLGIYRRVPVLVRHGDPDGNPWGVSFVRMIDMSNDSGLFRTRAELEADGWQRHGNGFHRGPDTMLPLYEAKMVHHFDHRWATYDEAGAIRDVTAAEHADPHFVVQPRYWVPAPEVDTKLAHRWPHNWLLGFRDICRSTDERTMIAATAPRTAVGNKLPLLLAERHEPWLFGSALACLACDFGSRQKLGGTTMNFFIAEQLPVLPPSAFGATAPWSSETVAEWVRPRVLELTYTAWDMEPFARDLGDSGPPWRWDDERRAGLRAELDGAFFHLYGIERDDADYILSTFPIVHRNDQRDHGEHRTWRLVMDAYDRLAKSISTGQPFRSALDPPPGHGPRHPPR
ncbi:MAG: DNA methyltransferase, partial [Actinomycetota bacterium]